MALARVCSAIFGHPHHRKSYSRERHVMQRVCQRHVSGRLAYGDQSTGNQPSHTENTINSSSPTQKEGKRPARDSSRAHPIQQLATMQGRRQPQSETQNAAHHPCHRHKRKRIERTRSHHVQHRCVVAQRNAPIAMQKGPAPREKPSFVPAHPLPTIAADASPPSIPKSAACPTLACNGNR